MPANFNAASMGNYGSTWQVRGYAGQGNVHPLLGTLTGRVVAVCGNAWTVFEDLEAVRAKYSDLVVFGVNDVGMYLDQLDHWATLHYANLLAWKSVRWLSGRGAWDTTVHSVQEAAGVHYVWANITPMFALSGYFAAQIAYVMGADKIFLCGCPGSAARRFFEATPKPEGYGGDVAVSDINLRKQFIDEMERVPDFAERMRSVSGWTRSYLGGL